MAKNLPSDWKSIYPPRSTIPFGSHWLRKNQFVALLVPSVLISGRDGSLNCIINPAHPNLGNVNFKAALRQAPSPWRSAFRTEPPARAGRQKYQCRVSGTYRFFPGRLDGPMACLGLICHCSPVLQVAVSLLYQVSSVKPTFTVTCQSATWLFSRWPRTSATSNHFIFRIVLPARVIAFFTASSMPFGEEPISSIFL
jgi:hypothetical protein